MQPFEVIRGELAAYFSRLPVTRRRTNPYAKYQRDPVAYARDVLRVHWWEKQEEVARAVVDHPRVMAKASHTVGKTHLAGGLVNWHFDAFDPSITKTTAPTKHQVENLTWKEVRAQRQGRGMLPKSPRIEAFHADDTIDKLHYAAGYTARDADSFQGDHAEHMGLIFEEATGIKAPFWTAAEGMLSSGEGNWMLAIFNPTDTSSEAYQQELSGDWHVITISALDHPNIRAELLGQPKPYPKAISLAWVQERIKKWCRPVEPGKQKATDIAWPPLDVCAELGIEPGYHRPGPKFEGRVLGRWPSQSVGSIWSEGAWLAAIACKVDLQLEAKNHQVEIGCDVARFGDDDTAIHVRRGPVSLHHESANGWSTSETAGRLKQLCRQFGHLYGIDPKKILVKIDDDGVGGGVVDKADGYNFVGVGAGAAAADEEGYPNRRSELWFAVAERAEEGRLDLSQLSPDALKEIRRQVMSPKWRLDSQGRRVVEPKQVTKDRLKRSPDDADAMNLAYAPVIVKRRAPSALAKRKAPKSSLWMP